MASEVQQQSDLWQAVQFEILDIADAGLSVRFIEQVLEATGPDEFVRRFLDGFDDYRA